MKIRKAKKEDLQEVGKLMLEEFSKPPFNEKVLFNNVLKSLSFYFNIGIIYILLEKNKIIGVVVFKIEQYWEGKVIIIEDLAVKEKYKRKGIGRLLINKVENYAKNNKIKYINFLTNKKSKSIKFYKKLGYKLLKNTVAFKKKIK